MAAAAVATAAASRSLSGFLIASAITARRHTLNPRRSARILIVPLAATTTTLLLRRSNTNTNRSFSSSSSPLLRPYCSTSTTPVSPSEAAAGSEEEEEDPVKTAAGSLDIRVGRVVRAWKHPEADSLYVEEVDVGEAENRTICSGLVNYIPLHNLQDIMVVVLANLKPRNMRGVKSSGMLMAASDASHGTVELLVPPEASVPGEKIWFGADDEKDKQPDPATPNQVQKKKIWESVQPHLKTTDDCIAVLGLHPMRTSAGVVTCRSLKNANIS